MTHQTKQSDYPMLEVDPVLELGIKELIRKVAQQKVKNFDHSRLDSFVDALYEVIRRVAMADDLTQEQYNKMQNTMMDGLGEVYFGGMDFDTLTLPKVDEFQDELISIVAECLVVVNEFIENLKDEHVA